MEVFVDIDKLTLGEVKEIQRLAVGNYHISRGLQPYGVGEKWFFRTVTHHLIGEIKAVGAQEILLKGGTVMWVADDGRFQDLFEKGQPKETEVYGQNDVVVGRGSVIDATELSVPIEVVRR